MRIAFFLEGMTEVIYLNHILQLIFDSSVKLSNLNLTRVKSVAKHPDYEPKNPLHEFTLFYVGNDKRVGSEILRQGGLRGKYNRVYGLRDMYSEEYRAIAKNKGIYGQEINQIVIDQMQRNIHKQMESLENTTIFFAVMEIEAWFLAIPEVFSRANEILTSEYIAKELGDSYDLAVIDPETQFYKPSKEISKIIRLSDPQYSYSKSQSQVYSLVNHITKEDLIKLNETERVLGFKLLYKELTSL